MSLSGFVLTTTIGFGAIVALSLGFSWVFARLYCKPKRRLLTQTPADYNLPFTSVTFLSHGVQLDGWFISPRSNPAPRPTIIVAHGWSNSKAQMLLVARLLYEAGFGVLLYDARGHGASGNDGPITIAKFAEDLIATVDYLERQPDVDTTRLGVVGHSIGGAGAILAASHEPRIRALVSSSAFADPLTLTWGIMRALHIPRWPFLWLVCRIIEGWLGVPMAEVAPVNRIGRVAAPMLLIHGDSDDFVSPSNLETLYTHAPQDHTQKWLVPGRRHSDVLQDSQGLAQVVKFLREHLRCAETAVSWGGVE